MAFLFPGCLYERRIAELEDRKWTKDEKEKQIRREAKATMILFAICCIWNIVFAYGLSGSGIRIGGLPLWWLISTPGMFIIAVVGVAYLLKRVFANFELEDAEEGGAGDE